MFLKIHNYEKCSHKSELVLCRLTIANFRFQFLGIKDPLFHIQKEIFYTLLAQ